MDHKSEHVSKLKDDLWHSEIVKEERDIALARGTTHVVPNAKLTRKIDLHIMPLVFICFFLQFLDKVMINYANIMGLQKNLHMKGQDFSWLATAFFIAYAVAEFPQGLLLQKFPVSKVLGGNMVCWGITICCTAAAQNYSTILALRILLGAFESIITPALVLITSQWYTRKQASPRTGLWYCGLGAAQIAGGLISWAAQHGPRDNSFPGWRIMFVAIGAFNLVIAIAVLIWLPNSVAAARFLSEDEKTQVMDTLAHDQGGNGSRVFKFTAITETIRDPAVWLILLSTIFISIPSGIVTTFSSILIAGFGYTHKQAALLNMPSGVVSIFATIVGTYAVMYNSPRWLSVVLLMCITVIGSALISFASHEQASALAGIYLINFCVAPLALVYALAGSNTQGYTKKVSTNATVAIGFAIGNIIGPQTFRANEAPGYISAKIVVLAANVATAVTITLLRLLYGYRNRQTADARQQKAEALANGQLDIQDLYDEGDMTDRSNPVFRYVY